MELFINDKETVKGKRILIEEFKDVKNVWITVDRNETMTFHTDNINKLEIKFDN